MVTNKGQMNSLKCCAVYISEKCLAVQYMGLCVYIHWWCSNISFSFLFL